MPIHPKHFCKILNQTCRNISTKSLVLKKKSRKKNFNPVTVSEMLEKAKTKKKTKLVTKQPSDYCEDIWLDGLNFKNLKLYRKTSFGSFRKINMNNFLSKLKIIYPDLMSNNNDQHLKSKGNQLLSQNNLKTSKASSDEKNELASPQMSELLLKNLLHFPMLREFTENPLTIAFEEEKDDYGVIDSVNFPSVTKILHDTMSPAARKRLEEWNQMMIQKLGEKEFQKYSKELLSQGSKFHRCLKTYLETGNVSDVVVDNEIKGCWHSLNKILPNISNVKVIEEAVHHPILMYKGIVDCVATYDNVPCVIEWKKSEKLKSDLSATHDAPLQLCAYLGALSWQKSLAPNTQGLVVIAYSCGSPANFFFMDSECCQLYWMQWLKRLQTYWVKKSSILVRKELEI